MNNNLPPISPSGMDPEVFRRVWNRVMPDREDCPLIPSPAPRHKSPPPRPVPQQPQPTQLLQELMTQLHTNLLQAQHLVRRHGSRPLLLRLVQERQLAMRKLSAAYFLACGQRFRPDGQSPTTPSHLPTALREQFLREQQWEQSCLQAAEALSDPAQRELLRALSRQSHSRSDEIRTRLERM